MNNQYVLYLKQSNLIHSFEHNQMHSDSFFNHFLPYDHAPEWSMKKNLNKAQFTDIQYAYEIGKNPKIELGGVKSQICMAIKTQNMQIEKLKQAWFKLYDIHPMLSAVSRESGFQEIDHLYRKEDSFEFIQVNENKSFNDKKKIIQSLIDSENIGRSSNKTKLYVFQFDDGEQQLFYVFDLMFIDIRSIWVLLNDLNKIYMRQEVKPLKYNFFDYLQSKQKFKESEQGYRDRAYWLSLLDQIQPAPELPLKQQPSQIEHAEFRQKNLILNQDELQVLRQRAEKWGVTAEALLLSIYIEVLRRWSKRQSFSVMNTNFSRYFFHQGIGKVVGNFLKPSLVMVTDHQNQSFIERTQALQKTLIESRLHSSFNGIECLREHIKHNHDQRMLSIPFVFSNTLNMNLDCPVTAGIYENAELIFTKSVTPQVWLENQIIALNHEVHINWNYVDGIFCDDVIDDMFSSFTKLILAVLNDDEIWGKGGIVAELPERDKVDRDLANQTEQPLPQQLLFEPILAQAIKQPLAIAVEQGKQQLSYAELVQSAYTLANEIRQRIDVQPNDLLVVTLPQSLELLIAILAVQMSGAAYVALAHDLPLERKKQIIQKCQAKAVLTTRDAMVQYDSLPCVEAVLEAKWFAAVSNFDYQQVLSSLQQKPTDLAYVIFTSGSTGEPKGVMINHVNALNTIVDINKKFNVTSSDAVLSLAPPNFDLSVYDYFGMLSAGGKIVFLSDPENLDPLMWWDEVQSHRVTIWNTVPAPFKLFVDKNLQRLKRSSLRLVLMSGDWIPVDLPKNVLAHSDQIQVMSLGGATEGSIWSIFFPITEVQESWSSIPYGSPLANQQFHVLNDWLEACPKYVTGDLYISGLGVAQGYLADLEKTSEQFFDHPVTKQRMYKTGDLGRYIENGLIEILGREDHQIKMNGYRIELGEIEAHLLQHNQINHVVIQAIEHHKTTKKQLVVYYVTSHQTAIADQVLKDYLAERLPTYMIPTYFVHLNSIPLTANGKINRKALPDPSSMNQEREPQEEYVVLNSTQQFLYTLLSDELKYNQFDCDKGFFDIGGDSLHAIGFISLLKTKCSIDIELEQNILEALFMNANIKEIAQSIDASQSVA